MSLESSFTSNTIPSESALTDPTPLSQVVETVISSLAQLESAMVHHEGSGTLWKFEYGTVAVFVQLTGETEEDLFTVWAPVLSLPAKDETALFRRLLAQNWSETLETRFAILNEEIVVLTQRVVADISPQEISRAVTLVATIADDNDEILVENYGLVN
jgi:hypothetical protein